VAENTKSGSYREPPVSEEVHNYARAKAEAIEPDDALIDRDPKTIYRWVGRAADRCRAESGEDGWQFVTPHDLRRTWGRSSSKPVCCRRSLWPGGWEDWQTFRDHYLGEFSPEAIRRERQKVDYLADRTVARSEQSRAGFSAFEARGRPTRTALPRRISLRRAERRAERFLSRQDEYPLSKRSKRVPPVDRASTTRCRP